MSTYPYLPGLPDDDDEDSASAHGRKRLALFSRHKRPGSGAGGMSQKQGQCANHKDKDGKDASGAGGKTATRSDVKETLKSMGLRCEDFTISVYSREQAHAILKRQGVEVTPNNLQGREKVALLTNKGMKNVKSSEIPKFSYMRSANTRSVGTHFGQDNEDDEDEDDDCVILDPPDVPKPAPKLPQQFQLMGTTVQVNRGAKRPSRPLTNQPQAKRSNARPMMYYRNDHEQDIGPEASVQDTLKRLKNYNISITCRRNASGMRPQGGMMDSESDMENDSHMDSDDDGEDMTKYLECQIGEIEEVQDEEIFDEEFDVDCDDKNDVDYTPRGKKRRQNKKSPRKGKRLSGMGTENKANEDSCTSDITPLVPNVEMADLSDHQASNHSEEQDQDPLAEENEDTKELRDILENATHLQEEEEEENNHNTNQENESKEAEESQETAKVDNSNVEKEVEDSKEETVDTLGELVEAEVDESVCKDNTADDDEEEEIDEELEKELLSGNLGDGEEGEMEDL